ncbi:MAG: S8 family serine peptidase, partial [Candidatus Contendobacter sp.]|nr:S8 family serine peptidase [Candidatus Contendobacter sp.]
MKIYTILGWIAALMLSIISPAGAQQSQSEVGFAPAVISQMNALWQEKASRTLAQRKIGSALLYELKRRRGDPLMNQVPTLRSAVQITDDGTTLVDIKAVVADELLSQIKSVGGTVINSFPQYRAIRASIPIDQIEGLAALPAVQSIRQADRFMLNKVNTSEGDLAHRANDARTTFGVNGTGVKIGVISDSVDALASLQASGDLPAVTVLSGQSGNPGSSEGTAMLEIVYDLAPGAQLFFATAYGGMAQFAQNILNLRAAGCDIIVDDISYFAEGAFQDDIISQAVNTVTTSGALYFSSAGNSGNLNDGTAGVWEGDYVGIALPAVLGGYVDAQNFGGGQNYNVITKDSPSVFILQWSDPLGASTNDYDLFLLNATGTAILDASVGVQDGTQDPIEGIGSSSNDLNNRLVIARYSGSPRFMRLNTNRGRLQIATAGQTWGHSAAQNAFGVAAAVWNACGGTPFCTTAPVETFSSDGPRKIFYNPDGTPITPGNFLATGGTVRQKPDITAADGVSTATPGFNPFYGTSAAAPHAAAIAGLMLSTNHSLTPTQVRSILTSTTWDIEASGVDRDSGAGILNAFAAVQAALPTYTVTATAGAHGSISPASRIVAQGATTTFTVTPDAGYTAAATGCGGSLSGTTYTTGPITAACTVTATFTQQTYTVTATAGAHGSISPAS